MITTAVKRITFEEFEQMPEQPGKQELLDGELIEMPPAKLKQNEIAERLYDYLKKLLSETRPLKLGKAHHEMGYKIAGGWLVPDVSVTHATQQSGDYYLDSPALAIEIISNEKTADHVDKKIKFYLENGSAEVWVLYPGQRHLWIYQPGGIGKVYSCSFRSELLAGQTIDLAEILK